MLAAMWRALVPTLLVATALAGGTGCGSSGDTATSAAGARQGAAAPAAGELDGRRFVASALHGREPIAGAPVGVAFEQGRVVVETGCNALSGRFVVRDGRLRAVELLQTTMGCEPSLTRQEAWLRTFVEAGPAIALDGRRLTLRDDDVTIELDEADRAAGPPPIAGTRWSLTTIADGGADGTASSVPAGVRAPTLTIGADGAVELFAGCNHGGGTAEVREDGFVDFGPLRLTRMACDPDAMRVEAAVTAILDGSVAAGFEGSNLSLAKDGRHLVFTPGG
jgi:heat shock protein HslJ